jgi:hypothetical protein
MPTKEQLEQALHDLGVPWSWDEYMAHSAQTKASSAEWFEKELKPMLREHAEQMLLKLLNHQPYTDEDVWKVVAAVLGP